MELLFVPVEKNANLVCWDNLVETTDLISSDIQPDYIFQEIYN